MNTRRTLPDRVRRRILQGAAAGAATSLFPPGLFAQQRNLAAAPRHALVIGNSRYKDSPLRNPANDAADISAALQGAGFRVAQLVDAARVQMSEAIRAYGDALAKDGAVGVFYFAGHGAQLNWRNFLVPVDAEIRRQQDIAERAVDLVELVESLKRAKNPANIVILDACRNNPFGRDFLTEQKGLSQMDAPTGTFLAYATAPGNVAIDGEGRNGLYTANLLKEIAVPEAKVEDIFKRVRLAVRRASKGFQIPWESTSLEDDVYFIPPRELKRLADEERIRLAREDFALWERAKGATEPAPLEEYLRRHPSGNFAELAQAQLERVLRAQGEKAVQLVTSAENPYSKGYARADTEFRIGDSYTYRASDLYTKVVTGEFPEVVTAIADGEVIYGDGSRHDLLGNGTRRRDGRVFRGAQFVPSEYSVGRRWTSNFTVVLPNGAESWSTMDMRIAARERVTVPAGTFDCFRIEGDGVSLGGGMMGGGQMTLRARAWLAPDRLRRPVATERFRQIGANRVVESERLELLAYKEQR